MEPTGEPPSPSAALLSGYALSFSLCCCCGACGAHNQAHARARHTALLLPLRTHSAPRRLRPGPPPDAAPGSHRHPRAHPGRTRRWGAPQAPHEGPRRAPLPRAPRGASARRRACARGTPPRTAAWRASAALPRRCVLAVAAGAVGWGGARCVPEVACGRKFSGRASLVCGGQSFSAAAGSSRAHHAAAGVAGMGTAWLMK